MRFRFRSPSAALAASLFAALTLLILFQDSHRAAHAQGIGKEFAENGTGPVVTFSVDDPEGRGLVWSLSGNDGDDFLIDEGVLSFGTPPDYEAPTDADTDNVYQVTVRVSDGTNTSMAGVTVTVTNVDEDGSILLSSVQPEEDTPFTATLRDPDGGVSNTVWLWEVSSDRTTWDAIAGATSHTHTPVDGDVGRYLRVTVTYDDAHGDDKTTRAAPDHEVHERHPDNHSPAFPASETGARSVAENTPAGTAFGDPVEATDEHHADVLTYSLRGVDASSFDIVRTSGQLLTGARLDYETMSNYSVVVRVSDPSNETDEVTVTISVTNVDEDGEITLSSAQPFVNTPFMAVLDDPDGDVSGVMWLWENSVDRMTWAQIDGADADSYTPVEGDVGSYLRASASYTDPEGAGKNAQAVSANPVREPVDHAPRFPPTETGVRTVPENTPPGTSIGDPFMAVDDDGHVLTYFLLESPDVASFELDESTGQLRTKAPLDYETKNIYSITVAVHDSDEGHGQGEHSSDAVLAASIVVTDVEYDCGTGNVVADAQNQPGLVADCEALLEARVNLAGSDALNWSVSTPITAWDGVSIGGTPKRVTRLDLQGRELSGIMPPDIGLLTGLEVLDLSDNRMTGSVLTSLDALTELRELRLSQNEFSGCIPSGLRDVESHDLVDIDLPYCDVLLSGLSISPGSLVQPFDPHLTSYTAVSDASRITVTPTSDRGAAFQFLDRLAKPQSDADGGTAGHQVDLNVSATFVKVRAVSMDGEAGHIYTILVANGDLFRRYDANENQMIERDEVFPAVDDYFAGIITLDEVLGIIELYFFP